MADIVPIKNNSKIIAYVKSSPFMITGATTGGTTNAANLAPEGIYSHKTGNVLYFKGLVAGNNITIVPSATGLTINSTASGGTGSSGVTYTEFQQYTGTTAPQTFVNKGLFNAYSGATLTDINSRVQKTVFNTYTGTTVPALLALKVDKSTFSTYTGTTQPILDSAVTGGTHLGNVAIFESKVGRNLRFKGLIAGTNITLTPSASGVTIDASTGSGGLDPALFQLYTGTTAPATYVNKGLFNTYSGTTYNDIQSRLLKTDFNTYTGTTVPALLNLKVDKTTLVTYTGTTAPAQFANKTLVNTYTGTTAPAQFVNKTLFNTYSGVTQPILNGAITGVTNLGTGISLLTKSGRNAVSKSLKSRGGIAVSGTTNDVTYYYTGSTGVPTSTFNTYTGTTAPATYQPKHTTVSITGNTTINATHNGKTLEVNGAYTITFPTGLTQGVIVNIMNIHASAAVTLASGAGATLNSYDNRKRLLFQWAGATVYHHTSGFWRATGNLQT